MDAREEETEAILNQAIRYSGRSRARVILDTWRVLGRGRAMHGQDARGVGMGRGILDDVTSGGRTRGDGACMREATGRVWGQGQLDCLEGSGQGWEGEILRALKI